MTPSCAKEARALERARLRARMRAVVVPGLEELVDPGADPADLIAMACRHATSLRARLEDALSLHPAAGPDSAIRAPVEHVREEERTWIREHLHDTALQILEFIAGDGFGTGLSAAKISCLAGGAARDLRQWIDADDEPATTELLPQLQAVASEARRLSPNVELVAGPVREPPTGEQATALVGAVREALNNALKHAHASRVVVDVHSDAGGAAAITVTDDGIGTDPDRVACARGLGVRDSILGRMSRVGGHASLDSTPGGGTRVTLLASAKTAA